jgi:hypothetical protein
LGRGIHNLREEVEVARLGVRVRPDPSYVLSAKSQQIDRFCRSILGLRVSPAPPHDQLPTNPEQRRSILDHNLKWSHSSGQNGVEGGPTSRPILDSGIHDVDVLKSALLGRSGDERALATGALDQHEPGAG